MKCNIAFWDRVLRFILGIMLTTWAFLGGPLWCWLGIYFLFTAAWGYCVFYAYFRIQTLKINSLRIKK